METLRDAEIHWETLRECENDRQWETLRIIESLWCYWYADDFLLIESTPHLEIEQVYLTDWGTEQIIEMLSHLKIVFIFETFIEVKTAEILKMFVVRGLFNGSVPRNKLFYWQPYLTWNTIGSQESLSSAAEKWNKKETKTGGFCRIKFTDQKSNVNPEVICCLYFVSNQMED